ncbi:MAG: extracellular solute-binding protein [Clostridia bacterium]|nr:extracellular solute-binding protein [Clostridia bacterium]
MKKAFILSVFVFVAALTGGCSPAQEEISSQEVSVIKIIKPEHIPEFTNIITAFNEENTDIQVRFVDAPLASGQRHQMYISALDGKDSSIDIYWINDEWTQEFVEEGYIVPLENGFKTPQEKYIVDASSMFSYDGRLYALPIGLDMNYIFRRSDIIGKLSGDWYGITSECSKASNGIIPVSAENSDTQDMLFNIIEIKNAQHCSYSEALMIYKEIVSDYYSSGGTAISFSSEFKTGNAVAMLGKASMRYRLNGNTSAVHGNVSMQQLPSGGENRIICGYGLAINSNSKNKNAALRFMRFLNSKEAMRRLSRDCGVMPVIESLYDDDMVLDANPYMRENLKETVKNAASCGSYDISGESYRKIEEAFLKYFSDKQTAEETGALLDSLLHKKEGDQK